MEDDTKHWSSPLVDLWVKCKAKARDGDGLYENNNLHYSTWSSDIEHCQTVLLASAVKHESRDQHVKLENHWPSLCASAEVNDHASVSKQTDAAEFRAEKNECPAFMEEDSADAEDTDVVCTTLTLQHLCKIRRLKEEALDVYLDAVTPSIDDQRTGFSAGKQEEDAAVLETCEGFGANPRGHLNAREESVCGKKTKGTRRMRSGKTTHRCELCPKSFPSLSKLQRHIRVHTGEKPFSCQLCQRKFPSVAQLKLHMRVHTGEKPFPCEVCNKPFGTKNDRKKHMTIHTGERNYSCSLCPKTFAVANGLKVHMGVHSGVRPYVCRICPKAFLTKGNRNRHELTHNAKKSHQCSQCPRSFATILELKRHTIVHNNEKQHPCTVCNERFKHLAGLNRHMLTHSDEKPFKCPLCSKGFRSSYQLKRHQSATNCGEPAQSKRWKDIGVKKSKGPSHACFMCQKTFRRSDHLTRHMLVHTKERVFSCTQCHKGYTDNRNLRQHIKVKHGEEDFKRHILLQAAKSI